jgi:hypothetical protein
MELFGQEIKNKSGTCLSIRLVWILGQNLRMAPRRIFNESTALNNDKEL